MNIINLEQTILGRAWAHVVREWKYSPLTVILITYILFKWGIDLAVYLEEDRIREDVIRWCSQGFTGE